MCEAVPAVDLQPPLCRNVSCRHRYRLLPASRLCSHCRRPLPDGVFGSWSYCGVECERANRSEISLAAQKARRVSLENLRAQQAQRRRITSLQRFPVVDLPTHRAPMMPLPRRRRLAFRNHLEALVRRVMAQGPSPQAGPAESDAPTAMASPEAWDGLAAQGCGRCRGYCCGGGGLSHAWLTEDTIAAYCRQHPAASEAEVVDRYLSFIGERTSRNSCVYHGRHGCTLAREMRSRTCNDYFCRPMVELHAQVPATGPGRAFFVTAERDGMQRGGFVVVRGRTTSES